ncbi:phage/plasmid primase, P4 family [Rothia sp. AR01]|uniref:Phage/plasmid primase, P4 family n=1 Tax=Rothia santali TaxID=2949643 RepID=A0A9X2HCW4_9MICC|nr:phage/plasmid primase, P4 family [Rothia santali]MCP3424804.1 phage/plasmid primase, P4 family [Rothia santali]
MSDYIFSHDPGEFHSIAAEKSLAVNGVEEADLAEAERQFLIRDADNLRSHARVAHIAAAECVNKFIHVPGLGWYHWNGMRFVLDVEDKAVTGAVMRVIGNYAVEALSDRELLADLVKSQTSSGLAGVVRIMSTITSLSAQVEELDADAYLLNTPSGVLDFREIETGSDWRSLTVRPHDPKYRMTQITRGAYDPNAYSELWQRFISTSLPDAEVQHYLQQAIGVGLVGEQVEHILPILTGVGRNGKGVFYGALLHALGNYATVASPSLFNIDRHATADKPSPALLSLRARRVVFMSETAKSAELDSARIKALSGNDRVVARGVHSKQTIEFDPSHLLFLITNHAPQLPADDTAVWERVRTVPWDVVVPPDQRDSGLGSKLRAEADTVLAWALAGLEAYFREGLVSPERVEEATDLYRTNQDTVSNFIAERCEDGCTDRESQSTKVLHTDYQKYCKANGVMREHVLGERDFGNRLSELGYASGKSGSRRFRQGLRLLPDDEEARAEIAKAEGLARAKALHTGDSPSDGPKKPGITYCG